jgi:acetylornithine deacetylase/succinyl-diaminopimelate desuccinylase-like protein
VAWPDDDDDSDIDCEFDSPRAYGRGVGDNLGPLAARLLAFRAAVDAGAPLPSVVWVLHGDEEIAGAPLPSVVWVLRGDEEIGSAGAHAVYPSLPLPDVVGRCKLNSC